MFFIKKERFKNCMLSCVRETFLKKMKEESLFPDEIQEKLQERFIS